jgi:hypothetical protein
MPHWANSPPYTRSARRYLASLENTMTYTRAKMIIWNASAYTSKEVRAAAAFILGSMNARREDIDQASLVV